MIKKTMWIVVLEGSRGLKRIIDIIGSAVGLIIFTPVFGLTALLIKLEDGGPVFFAQERVGKWGKPFTMYKFRSMIIGADDVKDELLEKNEAGGVIFKMKRDPRITEVGYVLRRFSLDELPQLYNVLEGDMSLVGPRPHPTSEVADYSLSDRRRLQVIPGITGLWQVSGRSNLTFEKQVALDIQYIESQSLWGDIVLLLKTIPVVLLGRGAY
jgi:lipopolysaccharide/colanic/teichoic acid biosynthesis glycosyltransferase